jgi:tetratricopeptide (TPR) repeat protein
MRWRRWIGMTRRLRAIKGHWRSGQISPRHNGNLGNTLEALNRLEDAIASYQTALALKPHLADVHHNLGNLWSSMGRAQESRAALETAVRLAPRKPEFYRSLAQMKSFTTADLNLAAMQDLAHDDQRRRLAVREPPASPTMQHERTIAARSGPVARLRGHALAKIGRDLADHVVPVIRRALAIERQRRVPGTVIAIQQPAPIGRRQHDPARPAERAGEMHDCRID